ncbi:MAG: type III secretion system chaperone [Sutterella sp.]|nr:type III secretion system chaperone [Sutterella sp.]
MTDREALKTLLSEFGAAMGLPDLTLDENNCCSILAGEDTVIHLQYREAAGDFLFVGPVGVLPEKDEDQSDVLKFLLISNLYGTDTDGGTLSLEPNGNIVLLHRVWDPKGADSARLVHALVAFGELLTLWQKRYADMLSEDDDGASPFEETAPEVPSVPVDPTLMA